MASAVKIKVCGITRFEDALEAAEAGVDLLGFNFYKKSPRHIAPEAAQPICDTLRAELEASCPLLIGLFVAARRSSRRERAHRCAGRACKPAPNPRPAPPPGLQAAGPLAEARRDAPDRASPLPALHRRPGRDARHVRPLDRGRRRDHRRRRAGRGRDVRSRRRSRPGRP